MTTLPFNPGGAIIVCLAWPKMAPFRVMPASNGVYKLTTISQVFDGHIWEVHSNEVKLSYAYQRPSENASSRL